MIKQSLKKGSGLSIIIISLMLVVIVLMSVPAFRALMIDNGTASKNVGDQIINITTPN